MMLLFGTDGLGGEIGKRPARLIPAGPPRAITRRAGLPSRPPTAFRTTVTPHLPIGWSSGARPMPRYRLRTLEGASALGAFALSPVPPFLFVTPSQEKFLPRAAWDLWNRVNARFLDARDALRRAGVPGTGAAQEPFLAANPRFREILAEHGKAYATLGALKGTIDSGRFDVGNLTASMSMLLDGLESIVAAAGAVVEGTLAGTAQIGKYVAIGAVALLGVIVAPHVLAAIRAARPAPAAGV